MMIFLFPKNMIKGLLVKKSTWKYDISCVFSNDGIFSPTNMILPFCQKSKDDPSPEK